MGMKTWGAGLVAAAIISAVTASGAPVVAAPAVAAPVPWSVPAVLSMPAAEKLFQPTYDLPAKLADQLVAVTPRIAAPDKLVGRWPCDLPIGIYYAADPGVDSRAIPQQLEYPVEYLRNLGYTVTVAEIDYHDNYLIPPTPGNMLVIAALSAADTKYMNNRGVIAYTEAPVSQGAIRSAKITVDANRGLGSDILLHEIGHALGLGHKPGTVMSDPVGDSLAFDAAETAAIDCR